MRVQVNADDYGLTRGITDEILQIVDQNVPVGVSLLPNGYAFDYAVQELRRRPHVRMAVHLNLVECAPLAPADQIPLLVNKQGYLANSLPSLWGRYVMSSLVGRAELAAQVRKELAAQLGRIMREFPDCKLELNSHQHLHMVPFVFDALIDLAREFPVHYIRLPREKMVWPRRISGSLATYCSLNVLKHVLLKVLSRRHGPILKKKAISHSDFFAGVLFTGYMTEEVVRDMFARFETDSENASVEILVHPGRAAAGEELYWSSRRGLLSYYFSSWRSRERDMLLSPSFSDLVYPHVNPADWRNR